MNHKHKPLKVYAALYYPDDTTTRILGVYSHRIMAQEKIKKHIKKKHGCNKHDCALCPNRYSVLEFSVKGMKKISMFYGMDAYVASELFR